MVWNKGLPLGTTPIKNSDQMIRDNNDAIETGLVPFVKLRLAQQAGDPSTISDTVQIYSKIENSFTRFFCKEANGSVIQITEGGAFPLSEISFTPTTSANKGFLYTKEISSKTELFWKDEVGNVLQITTLGILNLDIASKSDMETGTSITKVVTPGRAQYHPSAAKAWCFWDFPAGTPTARASYNVSSITDNGLGDVDIVFDVNMSSADYCVATCTIQGVVTGTRTLTGKNSAGWATTEWNGITEEQGVGKDTDSQSAVFFGGQ